MKHDRLEEQARLMDELVPDVRLAQNACPKCGGAELKTQWVMDIPYYKCQTCGHEFGADRLIRKELGDKTAMAISGSDLRERLMAEFPDSDEFEREAALYWYAHDYHAGQTSELYKVLSASKYKPGPLMTSVEDEGEPVAEMYHALEGMAKGAVLGQIETGDCYNCKFYGQRGGGGPDLACSNPESPYYGTTPGSLRCSEYMIGDIDWRDQPVDQGELQAEGAKVAEDQWVPLQSGGRGEKIVPNISPWATIDLNDRGVTLHWEGTNGLYGSGDFPDERAAMEHVEQLLRAGILENEGGPEGARTGGKHKLAWQRLIYLDGALVNRGEVNPLDDEDTPERLAASIGADLVGVTYGQSGETVTLRSTPTTSVTGKRAQWGKAPDVPAPSVGWGRPYGGEGASFLMSDGSPVWMFRNSQRVRFYDQSGQQVGEEQANVGPAVAYALSQGWQDVSGPQMKVPGYEGKEASKAHPESKWDFEDRGDRKFMVNLETGEYEDVTEEYDMFVGKGLFAADPDPDTLLSYLLMRRGRSMEGPLTAKWAGRYKMVRRDDGDYDVIDDQGNVVISQESYQVASNFIEGSPRGEYSEIDELRDALESRDGLSETSWGTFGRLALGTEGVRFIVTPGHGYLEVPDTPENRRYFTQFDYGRGGKLYLEEDVDAPKWLDEHGMADYKSIPTVYAEDDPKLRFLIH